MTELEKLKLRTREETAWAYIRAGIRRPSWRRLDPSDPRDAERIRELRALAHRTGVPYTSGARRRFGIEIR